MKLMPLTWEFTEQRLNTWILHAGIPRESLRLQSVVHKWLLKATVSAAVAQKAMSTYSVTKSGYIILSRLSLKPSSGRYTCNAKATHVSRFESTKPESTKPESTKPRPGQVVQNIITCHIANKPNSGQLSSAVDVTTHANDARRSSHAAISFPAVSICRHAKHPSSQFISVWMRQCSHNS